jgi:hypothetical protein
MKPQDFIPKKAETIDFDTVKKEEFELIKKRREKKKIKKLNPEKHALGLALSGGGVRSATFNLGLLQALNKYGVLDYVDYLSTVSGGGYIGSSLSWFMANNNGAFPFDKCEEKSDVKPVRWLRRYSSYLTPGDGLDFWALTAAILRGIFINLLIFIPIFFAFMYLLTWEFLPRIGISVDWTLIPVIKCWPKFNLFTGFCVLGVLMLFILLLFFFLYSALSWTKPLPFDDHRKYSAQNGKILKIGTVLIVIGLLPLIDAALTSDLMKQWRTTILSSVSFTGVISLIAGRVGFKEKDETRGMRAFLLRTGLTIILFVLILVLYRQAVVLHQTQNIIVFAAPVPHYIFIIFFVLVSLYLGVVSDINHVSMHRFYRDRLLEAYMPKLKGDEATFTPADTFYLKKIKIKQTGAPYQIVNTNLSTTGSKDKKYKKRGGANFIFSPKFVGSEALGYRKAEDYIGGEMSLATAFSISGAAVDPNMGRSRSRPLTFLMTLLNIRLGYWLHNPNRNFYFKKHPAPPFWHLYAFKEMMGWGMNEERHYIHLSDGGHFENLGLYELVHRKCPYIIISDAGADPGYTFKDLARACELVRADFCAEVEIDTQPLHPDEETGYSDQACVFGEIRYENGSPSKVIYIKTTMIEEGLPVDIHSYKRAHPKFPDESTTDQFFNEIQFEAYRELGFRIGEMIFKDWETSQTDNLDNLFSA